MKNIIHLIGNHKILLVLLGGIVGTIVDFKMFPTVGGGLHSSIYASVAAYVGRVMIIYLPFLLTGLNLYYFIRYLIKKNERAYYRFVEVAAIIIGLVYTHLYSDVRSINLSAAWYEQLYNNSRHSYIAPDTYPTIWTIIVIALAGYILLRFIPAGRQTPVISALGIAAVYLGTGLCVVYCIQMRLLHRWERVLHNFGEFIDSLRQF